MLKAVDVFSDAASNTYSQNKAKNLWLTTALNKYLYKSDLFEYALVKDWIHSLHVRKLPNSHVEKVGGKIFGFGSFRLGDFFKEADMDILCVAPDVANSKDFFTGFYDVLEKHPKVTQIISLQSTLVPVIKIKYEGIKMDILFISVKRKTVPDSMSIINLNNDDLIENRHPEYLRSLQGCVSTEQILNAVPNRKNFQITLRTIKLWAKRRSLYSSNIGMIGGVSWTVLVARICRLHPKEPPAVLVAEFFSHYSQCKWDEPIRVVETRTAPDFDSAKKKEKHPDLMQIMSPSWPEVNSTRTLSPLTDAVIKAEIREGYKAAQKAIESGSWHPLLCPVNFFLKYEEFIILKFTTDSKAVMDALQIGFESKIPLLLRRLSENAGVKTCHPNPKCFQPNMAARNFGHQENSVSLLWLLGIDMHQEIKTDLTYELDMFCQRVDELRKAWKQTMTVQTCIERREQLHRWLPPEELGKGHTEKIGLQPSKLNRMHGTSARGYCTSALSLANGCKMLLRLSRFR
uniref:polynucleotide adenylyltransferase n=1 Tax=Ditylenchus dipsaci TaxID=166011 RepID=A0A915CZ81_9BILA